LFLRFFSALGMGGEWSLGVALVMELWPNKTRGLLAGLIGAAANVGFFMTAVVTFGMGRFLPTLQGWLFDGGPRAGWRLALVENSAWRLMLLVGAAPALLTFFIRLLVPESERWQREHAQGKTSHWATRDLLGVVVGILGLFGIIFVWTPGIWHGADVPRTFQAIGSVTGFLVALAGFIYPVLRYLQRSRAQGEGWPVGKTLGRMLLGAALSGVAFVATWGAVQWGPIWAGILVEQQMRATTVAESPASPADEAAFKDSEVFKASVAKAASDARSQTQMISGIGAIIGTLAGALVGNLIGRRLTYTLLCASSFLVTLAFFQLNKTFGVQFLIISFGVGALTASFYGWLPLYLPELFPTNIRATGQGFGFNFGRILAAIGALQFGNLVKYFGGYPGACSTIVTVYLLGMVIIWAAPETRGQPLPE
jgi:MFS family permease